MRLNFTIRDCTDSNRPKVHDYVAMLRRILTQYPHAEFVFQFAPDGILSFYGEFLPDIKGIAAEMCWCVIDCDTDGYIQTGTACHTMIGVEITCRQTRTGLVSRQDRGKISGRRCSRPFLSPCHRFPSPHPYFRFPQLLPARLFPRFPSGLRPHARRVSAPGHQPCLQIQKR